MNVLLIISCQIFYTLQYALDFPNGKKIYGGLMKKKLILLCLLGLTFFLSGYNELITSGTMRSRMTFYNTLPADQASNSYIDSRLRLKFTNLFNERLKGVFQVEVGDIRWGDAFTGGDLGTDDVNIETKNLYFDFNCTSLMFDLRVGLQTVKEHTSLVLNADLAGLLIQKKIGNLDGEFGYGKLEENNVSEADDKDVFWFNLKNDFIGFNSIFTQRYVQGDHDIYSFWFIPYYLMQMNDLSLDLSLMYNNGYWLDWAGTYSKNQGFGADAKFQLKMNDTKLKLEVLYITGDDNTDDNEYSYFFDLGEYYCSGLEIFGRGIHDSASEGYFARIDELGKLDIIGKIEHKIDRFTLFGNAGFINNAAGDETQLATELDAGVKIDLCEALQFSFVGAYALLNEDLGFDDDLYEISSRFQYTFK